MSSLWPSLLFLFWKFKIEFALQINFLLTGSIVVGKDLETWLIYNLLASMLFKCSQANVMMIGYLWLQVGCELILWFNMHSTS